MSKTAFSIHGHFYQPPREDPVTGRIPSEEGAAPYENWNERIFHTCYKPNVDAGNFEWISFNIGPTLCDWMEKNSPETMRQIVEQERRSFIRYGVGNGMAQAYNHTILPLMDRRDKETQVRWGIADFSKRFGHQPAGMWLPEAAVDLETLEILSENGIQFTILAPWQAASEELDVTQPYRVDLANGKNLTIFFYEQELSTRISFVPDSTVNADLFCQEYLQPKFSKNHFNNQMMLAASDGELYGHHQPFREKFLAHLLTQSLPKTGIEWSFPGLWLTKFPPARTIKIRENTSWSCHHGITRWSDSCSCTPNNQWKKPFREGLIKIAQALDEIYLSRMCEWVRGDVWEWRHGYSCVLTGDQAIEEYVSNLAGAAVSVEQKFAIQLLLKAQYERQRMFTSCGWFFEDFDRIEPRNNVAYAAQAVWLTFLATGENIQPQAEEWLETVRSWRSGLSADSVFHYHFLRSTEQQGISIPNQP